MVKHHNPLSVFFHLCSGQPSSYYHDSGSMVGPYHPTTTGHCTAISLTPEATGLGVMERKEELGDYLSGLDWSEGDVRTNVRTVVDGLMKTSSADIHSAKMKVGGEKRSHDPRVTMEMRHREVSQSLEGFHVNRGILYMYVFQLKPSGFDGVKRNVLPLTVVCIVLWHCSCTIFPAQTVFECWSKTSVCRGHVVNS